MLLVSGSTATVRRLAGEGVPRIGHLLTPNNRNSVQSLVDTGLPWAVDNGAFSGFDADKFTALLDRIVGRPRLLWVACPDVVGDARATLRLFAEWQPQIKERGLPVAYVLQDGQERRTLPLGYGVDAVFLGGSTEYKLSHDAEKLCRAAKEAGKWVHVGRVNSRRRMRHCYEMGADSCDGSSLSMFGDKYIHKFVRWLDGFERQGTFV